jgi:hypothetical protein
MDEARSLLRPIVAGLRAKSREELLKLLDQPESFTVTASSGTDYQIEVEAFWDRKADGDLRVMVLIDDGGRSAFKPINDDFIVAPDGTFVGE